MSQEESVKVYLLDRAGEAANSFAAKLEGREGVQLAGGAADVEEALDDIGAVLPDVILVGTDLGGSGVVAAVERVMAMAPDAAVVALSTAADKALIAQAVRAGAAGSLDRTASPGETITALHVYSRRQRGERVDMSLADPPPQTMNLRVSGALPRFPDQPDENVYQPSNQQPMIGDEEVPAQPAAEPEAEPETSNESAQAYQAETEPSTSADYGIAPAAEETSNYEAPAETAEAESDVESGAPEETAAEAEAPVPEEPAYVPEYIRDSPAAGEESDTGDDDGDGVAHLRQMLRQEAAAAGAVGAQAKPKRGFLGLFKGKEEKKPGWGPKKEDSKPDDKEDTES